MNTKCPSNQNNFTNYFVRNRWIIILRTEYLVIALMKILSQSKWLRREHFSKYTLTIKMIILEVPLWMINLGTQTIIVITAWVSMHDWENISWWTPVTDELLHFFLAALSLIHITWSLVPRLVFESLTPNMDICLPYIIHKIFQ